MGYRALFRSVGAAIKQAEREEKRRQRELERQQKYMVKMQALEQAEHEVEVYENRLALLGSIHMQCEDTIDWEKLKTLPPPVEPKYSNTKESLAQRNFENFKPNILHKLFGLTEKKKTQLHHKITEAKRADKDNYDNQHRIYKQKFSDWEKIVDTATRILSGEIDVYRQVIKEENLFEEINQLGAEIVFDTIGKKTISVSVKVHNKDIVPTEIPRVLKSGKLSVKPMPKSRFNEIYQDYVCGSAIRIARELLALLPINNVLVNAYSQILNNATGNLEDGIILSVMIPRQKMKALNFSGIDPSNAMQNFAHTMAFKKNFGFIFVETLDPSKFSEDSGALVR